MAGKQVVRNGKPSNVPHRQQTAVRVAASAAPAAPTNIPYQNTTDVSTTASESSEESDVSTASKISSRISKSKFSRTEELPRKCLVVRRSAPKKGVTKTEIRLVIYNETQKKEGLRKMEYPALMDASEMLADRLRDLETKGKKDAYDKEKEVRRELEGERRPAPAPNQEKDAIAKLKKVAPSLCNDTTTATPIEAPSASSPNGSVHVEPSRKQRRNRVAPPPAPAKPTVTPSTTVISDKDLDDMISSSEKSESSRPISVDDPSEISKSSSTSNVSCPEKDCCMQQPCSKEDKTRPAAVAVVTPKKEKKKRRRSREKKRERDPEPEPRTAKVRTSPEEKNESAKPPKQKKVTDDSEVPSAPPPLPPKPIKKLPDSLQSDNDEESEVSLWPIRKAPPHAEREPKRAKNKKPVEPTEPSEPRRPKRVEPKEEPKEPIEPSEPRKPKKIRDQPKEEGPKGLIRDQTPLCDRRDCCMQQPCVKKDRKGEKEAESDQPTLTEKEDPSGKRGKKKKTRKDVVLRDDTSTTNSLRIEDSLFVLKRIHKKLDSTNSIRLKNNPDREKVKAQIEKLIRVIEGKLANGTKLNADDVDRIKRIVDKTAELRGAVSLTTTVTVTESVSVEDEETN